MELRKFNALPLGAALLLLLMQTDARDSSKRRQKEKSGHPHTNICDITERESKVHCYCENTQALKNATKAECWVFNGGISKDDAIWAGFASQPNIEALSFNVRADGGLSFIPTKALKHLRKLSSVIIKYATITEVSSHAFANMTSLRDVLLTRNGIGTLKKYAFAHLINLTALTMDENRIREVGEDVFYDLPSLQKLYLTANNITVIHGGAFRHLAGLLDLEMDKNNISTLSRETFDGLANLKRLDLRSNKISVLNDFTFMELWNLQELLLDNNEIHMIAERTFDGLSQLKKLSLSHNRITSLVSGLFEGARGLSSLDFRFNNLRVLTFDNVRPIYDNLKYPSSHLYLEGNEFDCDCRLTWMHQLRNDSKSVKIRSSLESFTCKLDSYHLSASNINHRHAAYDRINRDKSKPITSNIDYSGEADMTYGEEIEDSYQDISKHQGNEFNRDMKPLLQIPVEILPCPQEKKAPTGSTYTYPSQNEVKDFRNFYFSSPSRADHVIHSALSVLGIHFINWSFLKD